MDENNLNEIQLGEPIPTEYDYSLPISELDRMISEEYRLCESEGKQLSGEIAMLGCALDLISFAKENLDTELDFSESSLEKLRMIVLMMNESYAEEKPSDDIFATWVNMTAGLFGCIIIRNIGGYWIGSNAGVSVVSNGNVAFVTNSMLGGITGENKDADFIMNTYNYLKEQKKDAE